MQRIAVIMAGGSGERFWPLSRAKKPKQLLRLTDPKLTLLEEAVGRIKPLVGDDNVFVITGRHLEEPIRQSGAISAQNVWAEPEKRNTLGALVWVAAKLLVSSEEDVSIAVLTADHKIGDPDAFRRSVAIALETAEQTEALVTCGIVPTRPETGYGYIELDREARHESGAYRSRGFREKPDADTARQFVESGRFLWNAGMFFYRLHAFMRMLEQAHPEAHSLTLAILAALRIGDEAAATARFAELPNLSVDVAIAERVEELYVVEAGFAWDDVGAWDALSRSMDTEAGVVAVGPVTAIDCDQSILYNDHPDIRLTAVGMRNVVAVVTGDAVMLCPIDASQRVKELVERLKSEAPELL